ncbi:MAG: nitrilase family protein [Fimbriimonadaceae bacterium]|nr:nitrilase family protein [Fimbriimonadaceae bacterium]
MKARPCLRVGAVQMQSQPADQAANLAVVEQFCATAAAAGVELLVFPECCLTGYWFIRHLTPQQLADLAEPVPDGPGTAALQTLAARYGLLLGAGLVEAAADGFYNTYVVAAPDGQVWSHRKLQAFEHPLIRSGDQFTVFDTPLGWRLAVLICYDCNLVENVRMVALQGAEVLLAPHQTGGCRTTNPHLMGLIDRAVWDRREQDPAAIEAEFRGDKGRGWLLRWLPSRAHDNGLFLIFANGVGIDDDEIRTGNAMILDPYGRILTETSAAAAALVIADLDPALLTRATGREWIAARRPELYAPLAQRTGAERETRELKYEE